MFCPHIKPVSLSIAIVSGSFAFTSLAHANGADIINGWINSSKASTFFALNADKVAYDGASDVTTATNLTLTFTLDPKIFNISEKSVGDEAPAVEKIIRYQLKMPTISFTQLRESDNRYMATKISSPSIDLNFAVKTGKQNIVSTGAYTNFLATDLSWAKIPDVKEAPGKPASKYYPVFKALSDISFSEIKADKMELVQNNAEPAMTTHTVYNQMLYKNASHGNIAFSSIGSVSLKTDGKPVAYTARTGAIEIYEYNFGSLVRNFAPEIAPQENADYKTAIKKATIAKIAVTFEKGNVNIDSMAWDDIGVRPTPVPLLATLDNFMPKMMSKQKPEPQDIVDLVRSTYGAFKLGYSEVKGVSFDIDGVAGKLDSAVLKDLSSDGLGAHVFSGFAIKKQGEFDVSFGRINLAGVKFPALKALINLEAAKKRNDITAMLKAMPILGELSADDVKAEIAGKGTFSFDHAGYTMSGHIGPIPTNIETKLTNLVLPVSMLDRSARGPLTKMGYKTIKLSYNDGLKWNEADKALNIFTNLDMVDGGSYQFSATLGGLPKMLFETPAAAPGLLIGATLKNASFKFTDASIIDRGFGYVAKQQRTDVETLKKQVVDLIPLGLAKLKNPDFSKSVSDAVRTLLENKGSISASIAPETPVPLIELYTTYSTAPQTLVDRLKLKVEAR